MRNNKAMTKDLMAILLTIFVAVILMIFIGRWVLGAYNKVNVETCAQSVALTSAIGDRTSSTVFAPDLKCSRIQWHITKSDYYDKKMKQINYDKLRLDISDKMVGYWDGVTGKGTLAPFEKWSGNEVACLIGYEVTFDKDFVEAQGNTQFDHLDEWMKTNAPSKKDANYYDYMSVMMIQNQPIDTNKKYVIMWRADSDAHSWIVALTSAVGTGAAMGALGGTVVTPVAGTIVGAVGGSIIGTATYFWAEGNTSVASSLVFVPEETINQNINRGSETVKMCEHLYN